MVFGRVDIVDTNLTLRGDRHRTVATVASRPGGGRARRSRSRQWLASAGLAVVDLVEPPVPILKPELERSDYDRWFANIPTMLGLAARRVQAG
jgi:hypothetical protein